MIPVSFATSWTSTGGVSGDKSAAAPSSATHAGGACLIDLDGSGRPSLIVMGHGQPAVRVYRNNAANSFDLLTPEQTGLAASGYGIACAVGDFDSDGLPDLAVAMSDRVILFHNLGNGKFADMTKGVGHSAATIIRLALRSSISTTTGISTCL